MCQGGSPPCLGRLGCGGGGDGGDSEQVGAAAAASAAGGGGVAEGLEEEDHDVLRGADINWMNGWMDGWMEGRRYKGS